MLLKEQPQEEIVEPDAWKIDEERLKEAGLEGELDAPSSSDDAPAEGGGAAETARPTRNRRTTRLRSSSGPVPPAVFVRARPAARGRDGRAHQAA